MNRLLRPLTRLWVVMVIGAVVTVGGFVIYRFHGVFDAPRLASGDARVENIVSTVPKYVTYELTGPAGASGMVSYVDENSQPQQERFASLPWSHTLVTTLPSVFANVIAQGNSPALRCTITVNGELREQQSADGPDATAFCLVKAA